MTAWLARRVTASIAIVFLVVTLTFILMDLAPGKPMLGPPERIVDPQAEAVLERQFGLNGSLGVRYVSYVRQLARGNLGESFGLRRPVADALAEAIPNTLLLAGAALLVDFLIGLALGVYQALRAHRLPDIVLGNITLFLYSVPTFWLGLIPDPLPQRFLLLLPDGSAVAFGAAGADVGLRGGCGNGPVPARRDA